MSHPLQKPKTRKCVVCGNDNSTCTPGDCIEETRQGGITLSWNPEASNGTIVVSGIDGGVVPPRDRTKKTGDKSPTPAKATTTKEQTDGISKRSGPGKQGAGRKRPGQGTKRRAARGAAEPRRGGSLSSDDD